MLDMATGDTVVFSSAADVPQSSEQDFQNYFPHPVLEPRSVSPCQLPAYVSSSPGQEEMEPEEADDECPVLINEKALQESIEGENSQASSSGLSANGRRWDGQNPLKKFSILIGSRKLTFRVINTPQSMHGDLGSRRYDTDMNEYSSETDNFSENHETFGFDGPIHKCTICSREYAEKNALALHEKTHLVDRPYQCPICTKLFARLINWQMHMRLHASGRRYFCSYCGKWFKAEAQMLMHEEKCLAIMNGVAVETNRPLRYRCTYCERMFHHRKDKKIHERTHTGERPYTCGYCDKGFTQSQALTIHIRTHTGERPYKCSICGQRFKESSSMRKHELVKHSEELMSGDCDDGRVK